MGSDIDQVRADRKVDALYGSIRDRFAKEDARADGYIWGGHFKREREILLSLVSKAAEPIMEIACGSGLVVFPLVKDGVSVIGVDYNQTACTSAHANGILVVRGDAYSLPFRRNSVGTVINAGFLNQQPQASARKLLEEIANVLQPNGRAVIVWRNGRCLLHRLAAFLFPYLNRLRGRPNFPLVNHNMDDIRKHARSVGLNDSQAFQAFPYLKLKFDRQDSVGAFLLGASNYLVLHKK